MAVFDEMKEVVGDLAIVDEGELAPSAPAEPNTPPVEVPPAGEGEEPVASGESVPGEVTPTDGIEPGTQEVDNPPPAEEPKVETPNTDWSALTDGRFESEDAFKESDIFSQVDSLTKERDEYKTKSEENPYANDYVQKLNEYVANGGKDIETFTRLSSLNLEEMKSKDPANVIFFDMKNKHPELTENDIAGVINKKYCLTDAYSTESISRLREDGEDERADALESERNSARIQLKMDSSGSAESLAQYQVDMQHTDYQQAIEDDQRYYQELEDEWTPTLGKIADEFNEISISMENIKGLEGIEGLSAFKYEIPSEDKVKLTEAIPELLAARELEHTEENIGVARTILQDSYWNANRDNLIKSYLENALAVARKEWDIKAHNPATSIPDTPPTIEERSPLDIISEIEGLGRLHQ